MLRNCDQSPNRHVLAWFYTGMFLRVYRIWGTKRPSLHKLGLQWNHVSAKHVTDYFNCRVKIINLNHLTKIHMEYWVRSRRLSPRPRKGDAVRPWGTGPHDIHLHITHREREREAPHWLNPQTTHGCPQFKISAVDSEWWTWWAVDTLRGCQRV